MGTKGRKTRKRHGKRDSHLPAIEVNPNLHPESTQNLPKIIDDGKLNEKSKRRLVRRLSFISPTDLRHLDCIRILEPDQVKMPSGEKTTGLYYQKGNNRKAEIHLSLDLFHSESWVVGYTYWIVGKQHIIETLYHEIGHHVAHSGHGISGCYFP